MENLHIKEHGSLLKRGNNMVKTLLIVSLLFLGGCAALERVAPSQLDEQGQPIPGTHTAIPLLDNVAGAVPYGSEALNFILLITNFVALVRKNKIDKGFKATVQAIEMAGNDPLIKDAITKLKEKLSDAHQLTGTSKTVNSVLSSLKF